MEQPRQEAPETPWRFSLLIFDTFPRRFYGQRPARTFPYQKAGGTGLVEVGTDFFIKSRNFFKIVSGFSSLRCFIAIQ